MNVLKIALRSIQHRGFGSALSIISMALGVMLVVAVLTIHGMVAQSFKSNSSFGFNMIMGARGGALQLTLNSVFYLSEPIETIPYEYYLAFCDKETREKEFANSITLRALDLEIKAQRLGANATCLGAGGPLAILNDIATEALMEQQVDTMNTSEPGKYSHFTETAVPLCLGDYYEVPGSDEAYRVIGTQSSFFSLLLDVDTEKTFEFAKGRNMLDYDPDKNGYFEAVVGATVARNAGLEIGSPVYPTHGVPSDDAAHVHEQGFEVVGILEPTGTANDRVVFINVEGFFLMEDHVKPIQGEEAKSDSESEAASSDLPDADAVAQAGDMFSDDGWESPAKPGELDKREQPKTNSDKQKSESKKSPAHETEPTGGNIVRGVDVSKPIIVDLNKKPLPIEQRELTAVLVRNAQGEEFRGLMNDMHITNAINGGEMEKTLLWSQFRPRDSQKSAQAVNPIKQIALLFNSLLNPLRWLLLFLTLMICIVSGISILVGIYNSMSQRKQEIAVMRALGANRSKVMTIILLEAILLALAGGLLGWVGGHTLNVIASPYFEAKTGVPIRFFDFAPAVPVGSWLGGLSGLPNWMLDLKMSPEFLVIPGLIILAILVGIYPAITAYRTDVSKSLGK